MTKMLHDIHETVSSDDECIAHNRRIKSTTSTKASKEELDGDASGNAGANEGTVQREPRETKKRFDYYSGYKLD